MVAEIILVSPSPSPDESARQSAQYIARGLGTLGYRVQEQISVCENVRQLGQAVQAGLGRSHALVILGGLGPRFEYMAKTVIAQGLRLPLETNSEALAAMREYCRRSGEQISPADEELARVPRGSVVFPGEYGKIPGFVISSANQHIILLPETPGETVPMFGRQVSPYLGGRAGTAITRTVRTYGMGERRVKELLGSVATSSNPAVSIRSDRNEVVVEVTASAADAYQAAALCTPVLRTIVERLGDAAYGLDVDSLQAALVGKLGKKELDIAFAESGTDGLLARLFSETPGGQGLLRFSTVVDGDAAKQQLGVPARALKKHGEVSEYTAVAMADAARERARAGIGVAITAATSEYADRKTPEGLVYIAVCDDENVYVKKLVVGDGDVPDDAIIDAGVSRALNMARLFVDYQPGRYPGAVSLDKALDGKSAVTDRDSYDELGFAGAALAAGAVAGDGFGFGGKEKAPAAQKSDRQKKEKTGKDKPAKVKKGKSTAKDKKKTGGEGKTSGDKKSPMSPEKAKRKKRKKRMRQAVFTVALCVFLASASYIGYIVYQSYQAKKTAEELNNMFTFGEMGELTEIPEDFPEDYQVKFAGLWSLNPDVRAFVRIKDTPINYPIVQEMDNDYYLRRDFYKEDNQYGVPFFDFRVDVEKPSDNMMIYGHNMDTSGRFLDVKMFGEIVKYKDIEYYKEHPIIDYSTVYEDGVYKVFSVFITNAYQNQGHVFDYYNFIDAENDEQFSEFLHQLKARSVIDTGVDVEPGDKLITLSTCSYEFNDMRTVVVARRVRDGESEKVDVDAAKVNPNPLYPDIVYNKWGGTKPQGIDSYWTVGQNASAYIGYQGDENAPAASTPPAAERIEAPPESSAAASSAPAASSASSTASTSSTASQSSSSSEDDSTAAWLAERAQSRREEQERLEAEERRQSREEAARQSAESSASEPPSSTPEESSSAPESSISEPDFQPQPEEGGARADAENASQSAEQAQAEGG